MWMKVLSRIRLQSQLSLPLIRMQVQLALRLNRRHFLKTFVRTKAKEELNIHIYIYIYFERDPSEWSSPPQNAEKFVLRFNVEEFSDLEKESSIYVTLWHFLLTVRIYFLPNVSVFIQKGKEVQNVLQVLCNTGLVPMAIFLQKFLKHRVREISFCVIKFI
jgi:uncharacterized membrane protein YqaE (UPF0057 family)